MMLKASLKIPFILIFVATNLFAQPTVRGKLIFLGKTSDSSQSVWLSATTSGSFNLEAQGKQLIDSWQMRGRGIHLSLSPVVSQGNGGTHFLINRQNNRQLDSQNQKGGIVFPPLPSEPPGVMPPIVPFPEHPIVIPPGSPPSVSHPIPPSIQHPIVIPPGSPPSVSHPIPPSIQHPIVIPPGSPPSVSHPIPPSVEHPIVIPPGSSSQTETGPQIPGSVSVKVTQSIPHENSEEVLQQAPITEARAFDEEKEWNIWSDNYYFNINDGRNNLDAKGAITNFVIGADRHITSKLVLGSFLNFLKYNYNAFSDTLLNRATGFNLGPYFGYSISPNWSANGSITYGQLQNNNELASLNSEYKTQVYHADLYATGLYQFQRFQLRPKPLISFTHYRNPAYQFNGVFRNRPFKVNHEKESFNYNFVQLRLEGNYTIETKKGSIMQAYAEPGINYAFSRPNDGQMITGNLGLASTAPVAETLTLGLRTLFSKVFLIDASASYLSFGQQGLDVWEWRLLASYSFG